MVERVSSGVHGFDELIEGGYVAGSVGLIVGRTGTGKTQFCSSFIYDGANKGESGLYITTEERVEDIKADLKHMFSWDFDIFEEKGLVNFLSIKPIFPDKPIGEDLNRITKNYMVDLMDKIAIAVDRIKAKRVVIDSISILEMFIQDKYIARVALMSLTEKLRSMGVTTLMSGEIPETSDGLSGSGMIEYLVDAVIKVEFVPVSEEFKRTVTIRKMRKTDHSTLIHPFEITPEGIRIVKI